MERAEDTARILDVNYHMLLEGARRPYRLRWEPLVVITGEHERFFALLRGGDAGDGLRVPRLQRRQSRLDRPVRRQRARERAHHPRPHLARDVGGRERPLPRRQPLPARRRPRPPGRTASATSSSSAATASRASPRRRCRATRAGTSSTPASALERAEMTARIVDVQYHTLLEGLQAASPTTISGWRCSARSRRTSSIAAATTRASSPSASPSCCSSHPHHPRSIRFNVAALQRALSRAQRHGAGHLRQRGRAPRRAAERPAQVRPHRGHLRARPASLPGGGADRPAARSAPRSRAATSTTRWPHEPRRRSCT